MTKDAKNESKRGRNKQASPQVSLIRHYRLPLLRDPVKIGLLRILKKELNFTPNPSIMVGLGITKEKTPDNQNCKCKGYDKKLDPCHAID